MIPDSEPPLTIGELTEYQDLQLKAEGRTPDDAVRSFRAALSAMRDGRTPPPHEHKAGVARSSMEARISALEAEVKRLRELLEGGPKNG